MVDSIINTKKVTYADVVILSAGYDKTASSHKGTVNGPKAVIGMLESKLELFDRALGMQPSDKITITKKELKDLNSLSPEKALAKITKECEALLAHDAFVFLLGGEHSVSLGLFQALAKKVDPKDVTILQIDAHCDLRNDDSDYNPKPTNLAHSCVLRRAHELGYNLVQVGIRTYSVHEHEYFSDPKNKITTWQWGVGKKVPAITEVIKSIKTKYVYITIDVDGFDPVHMPGTGTPVQGGLEWWYGMELVLKTIKEKNLIGCDIVEVSPMRDTVLTEYGAAQLCYSMITEKFKNKLK